jgi:hypothetical protein
MLELLLPGIGLAVCVLLLARLAIGARRRYLLDAAARRGWARLRRALQRPRRGPPRPRDIEAEAAREAEELIRRVRRDVEREGNVIRPRAFQPRRDDREREPPRKPH